MADLLLTLHCAAADAEAIGDALRAAFAVPVHLREERVLGSDFSDATTAERVTARLERRAIELIVPQERESEALALVEGVRRDGPVRWHTCPILARGRFA